MAAAVTVALLLALGAVAVVLGGGGGCGGSGYPGSPECVASEYVRRTDHSKCDLVAPALLEQVTGARGEQARRICADSAARATPPEEVRVLERETVGDTVVVELLTDGIEGKLTLSRAAGRWQITSFAE